MRPLTLHTSALNDAEYALFTDSLGSLLDSDSGDLEAQTLTIREVRAWMRGRYPGVPAATIDQILALFPSKDAIRGGEFFAALRLVLHIESGKEVDRALAFVQVPVGSLTLGHPVSAPAAIPVTTSAATVAAAVVPAPAPPPVSESVYPRSPNRSNPFLPPTPSLTRSKTTPSPSPAPILPPRKAPGPHLAPVPPPRHPPLPPRSGSPPKPATAGHITSTLMKQSLQASKTGQWLKQGQVRLEQERILSVIRSTSNTPRPAPATSENDYFSSSSSHGSRSRNRLSYSVPPSVSSLEQVALASSSNTLQHAFDDAYREREAALPPPMHPDRKSAPPSTSSRASASSSSSRPRASPEREKPRPPPKPRSLNAASQSPFASPPSQTRLTRSHSLRPSPPPPSERTGRVRPESVHALLGNIGSLRLTESPFGDPVRPRRPRREDKEVLIARREPSEQDVDSSSDSDGDADDGWVGVRHFDSDADATPPGGVRGRSQSTTAAHERDSLKWPVDVDGEGWRPL
ncbi:hypothetical protein C8J57DRAFT_1301242 [Mycena rebaudengoi]|nr:hypothetical protein C8J57DRAFT_1301242 [Mycena rebaudengoi]